MDPKKIDVEALRELYQMDPAARSLLDHLGARQRSRRVSNVHRMEANLADDGDALPRQAIIRVFRRLEALGCGAFVVGRKGHVSRFRWDVSSVSVGKVASGQAAQIDATIDEVAEKKAAQTQEPARPGWFDHTMYLRPGKTVTIKLPGNLTPREARRLALFVRSIPFGPRPGQGAGRPGCGPNQAGKPWKRRQQNLDV